MKTDQYTNTMKLRTKISLFLQKDNIAGNVFILPFIIGFLLFTLVPIISSFVLSFTNYNLLSAPTWAGLSNYISMFSGDRLFNTALKVTFLYTFISVPLKLIFALMVALVLNHQSKMVGIYRSLYYLPTLVGGSIPVAVAWRLMFQKEGLINTILQSVGIDSHIGWLANPDTAIWILILLTVWQYGSSMVIFLAGLKQIPAAYYEAAKVDGAGSIRSFFRITLPMLSPIIFFNLVMQLISGFIAFTQAYVITQGKPMNSTLMYILYLYNQAFRSTNMGYACAMAWFMLIIISFFTALVFKSSSTWVYYETDSRR